MHVYLARDLEPSPLEPDEDERIQTEWHPLSLIHDRIRAGEIQDAKTIAALLMATCLSETSR
jgi:ADP-ribose pyrophosphatase